MSPFLWSRLFAFGKLDDSEFDAVYFFIPLGLDEVIVVETWQVVSGGDSVKGGERWRQRGVDDLRVMAWA